MKLVHPALLQPIELEENAVNVVVIENKKLFGELVWALEKQNQGSSGDYILSQEGKALDLTKTLELVIDIFGASVNQRKALTKLYTSLQKQAVSSEHYLATTALLQQLEYYLTELLADEDVGVSFNEHIDLTAIFKMAEVKFSSEDETLAEKLIDYMSIMRDYGEIQCFVLVNLKSYFDQATLANLYTDICYKKIRVLLLENKCSEQIDVREKGFIIDEDLCVI
ncbi:MAG: type II-A CRISPR-associated protein Csn2 [Acidaminococcaceae bacterium]